MLVTLRSSFGLNAQILVQLPLANPSDSSSDQSDVVHHGLQEDSKEGLLYSGVFVEEAA